MWKLIFLGLIVWLLVYILKRAIQPTANRQSNDTADNSKPTGEPVENMVQCANCHVHLPRSEAFLVDGNFYCSKAHIENK
jgi:cytochrome c553